jgi:uncharacterized phage infection (PIP) family protein YhgE
MTSLHETLPLLDKAVPTFGPKLQAAADLAENAEDAARGLLEHLQEKKARASELLAAVTTAMGTLDAAAEGGADGLRTALTAMQSALAKAQQRLDDGADAVKDGLALTASALSALQDRVTEATSRDLSLRKDVGTALSDLSDELESGYATVEEAVGRSKAAADAVDTRIGEVESDLEDTAAAFETHLGEVRQRLRGTLAVWEARLLENAPSHQDALLKPIEVFETEGLDRINVELSLRVVDEAKTPMEAVLQQIELTRAALEKAAERMDETAGTRGGAVSLALATVDERTEPLKGGLEAVRRAAEQVGEPWP